MSKEFTEGYTKAIVDAIELAEEVVWQKVQRDLLVSKLRDLIEDEED